MHPATMDAQRRTDPAAFVARHQRALLRWLDALGCAPDRAEEHCQDALLAALHHGVDERPAATAAAWLRRAAQNLFWMRLRQERRRPPVTALDELEAAWQAVGGDRLAADRSQEDPALAALRRCLDAAHERDRRALELRYRDGLSRGAMAAELTMTEAGVKQALRRARARLHDCVQQRVREEER